MLYSEIDVRSEGWGWRGFCDGDDEIARMEIVTDGDSQGWR